MIPCPSCFGEGQVPSNVFENTEAEGAESVGNQGNLVLHNFCYLSLPGTSQISLTCWKYKNKTKACQQVNDEQRFPLICDICSCRKWQACWLHEEGSMVKVTGLSIIYSVTYWSKCIHNLKELKLELLGTWGEWLCQTPLNPSSLIVFLGSFKPRLLSLILFQSWNTGDHCSFWCHSIWSLLCPMQSR